MLALGSEEPWRGPFKEALLRCVLQLLRPLCRLHSKYKKEGLRGFLVARVKVIVALVAIFAVVSSQGVLFPALVFSLASMGMLLVELPAAFMLERFLAPLGSILILFLLHAVLYGWTPLFSLQLFGQHVVIMQEGVLRGMHLACSVLGGFGVMVLLRSVTPSRLERVWKDDADEGARWSCQASKRNCSYIRAKAREYSKA
jgi:hypothetical protein